MELLVMLVEMVVVWFAFFRSDIMAHSLQPQIERACVSWRNSLPNLYFLLLMVLPLEFGLHLVYVVKGD